MRMWTPYIICYLLLLAGPARSADLPKVLVINSYHAEYPWVASHNAALIKGLAGIADLSFFNMDTKRIHPAHHRERADLALEHYRALKPKLVILTDDNALAFLGREITKLGTPVVYLGINGNPRHYIEDTSRMTGVLERPLLKRSVVFLQDILGMKLDKCLVLFDHGTTARATLDTVFRGNQRITMGGTTTDIILIRTFSEWQHYVLASKEKGYDAIILGLYHTLTDDEGQHVSDELIACWTSENAPIPVFGFWDFSVGSDKAIGGLVLAGKPQGEAAVSLARRILAGEPAGQIEPVTAETGRFLFSKAQMVKWNIILDPAMTLPSDTLEFID